MRLKVGGGLILLCVGTAVAMAVSGHGDADTNASEVVSAVSKTATDHSSKPNNDLNLDLSAIKRTIPKSTQAAGLFQSKSWYTPPPPPPVSALPPPPPSAPTLPFAYIGKMIDSGEVILFLSRNDRQYTVKTNDVLDDTYRVDKITDTSVELTYLPMNIQQTLSFNTTAVNTALNAPTSRSMPDLPLIPSIPPQPKNVLVTR